MSLSQSKLEIPPLVTRDHAFRAAQNAVRRQGYAVALHGSQIRDLDLLAVPWQRTAIDAEHCAETIAKAIPGTLIQPVEAKPHGRLAWEIHPLRIDGQRWGYGFDQWYVDLSVMPRSACDEHEWGRWQDDPAGVVRSCPYCDAVDWRPEG